MDYCVSFLVTILGPADVSYKVALKANVPAKIMMSPMDHREDLHKLLPAHCRDLGPIVAVEEIHDVHVDGV
jgi:hypothetical protein